MDSEKYNGWSNRETWAIALHVSNSQEPYEAACSLVALVKAESNDPKAQANILGEKLREWMEDVWTQFFYAAQIGDGRWFKEWPWVGFMVNDVGSLWRVDWREWASNLLAD